MLNTINTYPTIMNIEELQLISMFKTHNFNIKVAYYIEELHALPKMTMLFEIQLLK